MPALVEPDPDLIDPSLPFPEASVQRSDRKFSSSFRPQFKKSFMDHEKRNFNFNYESGSANSKRKGLEDIADCSKKVHLRSIDSLNLSEFSHLKLSSNPKDMTGRLRLAESPIACNSDLSDQNKRLLKSAVDKDGNTELHLQIFNKNQAGAFRLIMKATEFDDLNVPNFFGETPLHAAVLYPQPKVVRRLMCAGALVSIQDNEGNTPLHLACNQGYTDVIYQLLASIQYDEIKDNSYQIPFCAIPQDLTIKNKDGHTCFKLAEINEHTDIMSLLNKSF